MKVIGSSEEASRLSREIVAATSKMVEETEKIRQAFGKLEETFLDEEVLQMKAVVEQIIKTITAYMDDIVNVKTVMDRYAELLRQRGR